MFQYLLFTFLIFVGIQSSASENLWPWEIQKVEVEEVQDPQFAPLATEDGCDPKDHRNSPFGTGVSLEDIVMIGEQVWKIVEQNKPVVTFKAPVVHALPRGLSCWSDLEQWQPPKTRTFEVIYLNGFNMEAVKFRFRLHYTYGGGSQGKGRYLANVTVMPAELNVLWGYNFDAFVEAVDAVNLGTRESPLAGLELNMKWTVRTWAKESQSTFHFFVQGDGASQTSE